MALFELPMRNDTQRRILHVDMDAFYASIEMRDAPALRRRALVIAHDPRTTGGKGVVTTANYVARQYGVHSAMPANEALRLVPKHLLTFKDPDFTKYRAVSHQIHDIFRQVTDLMEPVALDEAYLDVTANHDFPSKVALALWLQDQIREATQLTCSFGLSYNKFLAKEASEYNKPRGRTVIMPAQAQLFLDALPIAAFRGVGKKTLPKLEAMGAIDGAHLRAFSQSELIDAFGKFGFGLYQHVRGIDLRPVERRVAKSIGKEETYRTFLTTETQVRERLEALAAMVEDALARHQMHGKVVALKVRDSEFETQTRRRTLDHFIADRQQLFDQAWSLWQERAERPAGVRLLGITMTGLEPAQYVNLDLDV
ncbi:DNA polymerase IV [Lacticaseibacillus yichunensis]|uniref:DNA polymerase IV n=1 Tax=Lacticaseibacillus yichunensis TaxID=2486015 RepID=A0ABW4CKD1_9LACO|nr:DNA polymerase IV [Lacticaseibacillus yichunensis]